MNDLMSPLLNGVTQPTALPPHLAAALNKPGSGNENFAAMLSAQNDPSAATTPPANGHANARALAEDFEAAFLNTMLSQMFAGIKSSEPFGGGHAEETYQGMMVEEYAKAMADSGGIGIADAIETQLIALQEAAGR
jgi:flagellar protein FlgJ